MSKYFDDAQILSKKLPGDEQVLQALVVRAFEGIKREELPFASLVHHLAAATATITIMVSGGDSGKMDQFLKIFLRLVRDRVADMAAEMESDTDPQSGNQVH